MYEVSGTSSSAFNFVGLVSNLDTNAIITKLMEFERQPVTALEARKTDLTSQLTAWRDLNSRLLALQSAASSLYNPSSFQAKTATSNDLEILTASALSTAALSTYSIEVIDLAQAQQLLSQGYAGESSNIGTGTFSFTVDGAVKTVTIDSGNSTLQGLATAINQSNGGVTASIINTGEGGSPYKLMLTSKTYGEDGEISIENNLSGGTAPDFSTILQAAQDAHIKLGNQDIYRSGNTINDVISGLTLNLKKAEPGTTVTLSVASNQSSVKASINGLLKAYNDLNSFFADQFSYDSDSGRQGTLFGDTSLMLIQDRVYSKITSYVSADGILHNLAAIGVTTDGAGNLTLSDESKLTEAVNNQNQDLVNMFTDPVDGLAVRVKDYLDAALTPATGAVSASEEYINSLIADLDLSIADKEEYLTRVEESYRKQYTALEQALALIQSQGSYLQSQLSSINANWLYNQK